ncbi:MAG: ComF family protein [Cryomorphaceae bacterium]|nr:ComF family protein [Cryomorphaceae bacterium]
MKSNLPADFFDALLHFIYPDVCVNCARTLTASEEFLCIYCEEDLPLTRFEKLEDNPVTHVFFGRVPLVYGDAFCYFKKQSAVQRLLHYLKYMRQPGIGRYLGLFMGLQILTKPWPEIPDYIIPVPLHPKKRRIRGYNQAEELAYGVSRVCDAPVLYNVVKRGTHTPSQTKLSRWDRWVNVSDTFYVENTEYLPPCAHILLVDDVITTGATLEACASKLLEVRNDIRISVFSAALAKG